MRPTVGHHGVNQFAFGESVLAAMASFLRMIEADPTVYGPGVNPNNIDQNRLYAGCPSTPGPCNFASVGIVTNVANSTYHSGQISLSRHFAEPEARALDHAQNGAGMARGHRVRLDNCKCLFDCH